MSAAVSVVDARGRLVLVNRAYERLLGVSRRDRAGAAAGGEPQRGLRAPERRGRRQGAPDRAGLPCPVYETLTGSGGTRWLLATKAPIEHGPGLAGQVLTVALDVTELRASEAAATAPLQDDPLTGLPPSGGYFRTRFEHELARARRQHEMLAVLHLDLDRFKGVNEAFGKEFGSELLREVALRLKARLTANELLARVESDEFRSCRPASSAPTTLRS